MITLAALKSDLKRERRLKPTVMRAVDGYSFRVQSGLLAIREPNGAILSVPLTDVSYLEGCAGTPPKEPYTP